MEGIPMPRARRSSSPAPSAPIALTHDQRAPAAPSPAELRAQARAILRELHAKQGTPMPEPPPSPFKALWDAAMRKRLPAGRE
jgi:hypothetical protein